MNLDKSEFFVNQKKHLILKTGADKDDYAYIKHDKVDTFTQRYLEFLFANYEADELLKSITYIQQQIGIVRNKHSSDTSDDISDESESDSDDSDSDSDSSESDSSSESD
jgi:hypothetical protein